uniref:Uncharacterized protein n=1 Tax=Rhizophora mucronata TaxID=61149 RepID=A0A2P2IJP2_RHIMU
MKSLHNMSDLCIFKIRNKLGSFFFGLLH